MYLFGGLCWLNPDESYEAQLLSDGLSRLISAFPHLGEVTEFERLAVILRRNRGEWDQSAWKHSCRRRRRALISRSGSTISRAAHADSSMASSPSEPCGAGSSSFVLSPRPSSINGDQAANAPHNLPHHWPLAASFGSHMPSSAALPARVLPGPAHHPPSDHWPNGTFALIPLSPPPPSATHGPTSFAANGAQDAAPATAPPPALIKNDPTAAFSGEEREPASPMVCGDSSGGHEWLMEDSDPFEPADPAGAAGGGGGRRGSGRWGVGSLDLPPAGDPGAAWATFDALLPQILNST